MPSPRLHLIPASIAFASVTLLGSATTSGLTATTSTLRIESMSPRRLQVEIASTPPGLSTDSVSTREAQPKVVIVTPAWVTVADSVRMLHVVVLGTGAVRLFFDSASTTPGPRAPIWGRDITLVRQADGHFQPVPRTHLLP